MADDLDGFMTPDGELVSVKDTDRIFSVVVKGTENRDQVAQALCCFAKYCLDRLYFRAAHDYLGKILSLVDDSNRQAF